MGCTWLANTSCRPAPLAEQGLEQARAHACLLTSGLSPEVVLLPPSPSTMRVTKAE